MQYSFYLFSGCRLKKKGAIFQLRIRTNASLSIFRYRLKTHLFELAQLFSFYLRVYSPLIFYLFWTLNKYYYYCPNIKQSCTIVYSKAEVLEFFNQIICNVCTPQYCLLFKSMTRLLIDNILKYIYVTRKNVQIIIIRSSFCQTLIVIKYK